MTSCVRCDTPTPGVPVTDPDDRAARKYCTERCRDADAEAAYEQHYPSGVAT